MSVMPFSAENSDLLSPRKYVEGLASLWFDECASGDFDDREYTDLFGEYLLRMTGFHLYKYLSPFTSLESFTRFLSSIEDNTLSFSALSAFNDPFDSQFGLQNSNGQATSTNLPNVLDCVARICCLTEHWDNRLMWSHYASSYRGVCIEYDLSSDWDRLVSEYLIFPVIYQNERPSIPQWMMPKPSYPIDRLSIAHSMELTKNFFVKDSAWEYEAEWRIYKLHGPRTPEPKFVTERLLRISKIYLGAHWRQGIEHSDLCLDQLLNVCQKSSYPIEVYETALNKYCYKVDPGTKLL